MKENILMKQAIQLYSQQTFEAFEVQLSHKSYYKWGTKNN